MQVLKANRRVEMVTVKRRVFAIFFALFIFSTLHGCATNAENLVHEDKVNVETVQSEYGHLSRISVWAGEAGTEIIGEVHGSSHGRGYIRGHVDVEVIKPDDTIFLTERFNYHNRGGKSRVTPFSIMIPTVVPDGSTIRLTHHATADGHK
jgi:hypothetical protein